MNKEKTVSRRARWLTKARQHSGSCLLSSVFLLSLVFALRAQTAHAAMPMVRPMEFGMEEFRAAQKTKGLTISLDTELNLDQPETFKIVAVRQPNVFRITGGDLRGLMYGLIEASEQVRNVGKLAPTTGVPGLAERGVRLAPTDGDLMAPGFYASERWLNLFRSLARNRINRFTLVLPPSQVQIDRINYLARAAADVGVDFALGLRPPLDSRSLYPQLRQVLDQCPLIRTLEVDASREPLGTFASSIFPAIRGTGRRVTLDLHGAESRPDVVNAALSQGIAVMVGRADVAGFASTIPDPSDETVHVLISGQTAGSGTDTAAVQARVAATRIAGASGFEVDLPGPNFEQYERFYWAWGRQGYAQAEEPKPAAGKNTPASSTSKAKPAPPAKK